MRKLIVSCDCGTKIRVPYSAIGRSGLCPECGRTVAITGARAVPSNGNDAADSGDGSTRARGIRRLFGRGAKNEEEDAKRRFAKAVDLYFSHRYAEALAIFADLSRRFPGNADIASGHEQCLQALQAPPRLALKDESAAEGALDADTVRRTVLDKLLHGSTEQVQLQAADIACRMLGLYAGSGAKARGGRKSDTARVDAKAGSDSVGLWQSVDSGENQDGDENGESGAFYVRPAGFVDF
jgi:hypothetical protein